MGGTLKGPLGEVCPILHRFFACDAVGGSSTGIAMCQIIGPSHEPPMSLLGTTRTFSALWG